MPFGDATPFIGMGKWHHVPLEVQVIPILPHQCLQRLHLPLVAEIALIVHRGEKGLDILDMLAGDSMDTHIDNPLGVGVIDLPVGQWGVEEADAQLEAHRACNTNQGRSIQHLLCGSDAVMVNAPHDPKPRLPRLPCGSRWLIGAERPCGVDMVVHLLQGSPNPFSTLYLLSQETGGLKPFPLVLIIDLLFQVVH